MRRSLLLIPLALAIVGSTVLASPAGAASVQGRPCTKQGATRAEAGASLTCTRTSDGRLVWTRQQATTSAGIPSIIENWGFDLAPYDAATKMAGSMSLAPIAFPQGSFIDRPISYYGAGAMRPQDPPGYLDPQMTFFLPIGTTVKAIASGRVCTVTKLQNGYSDDYSIGIAPACSVNTAGGHGFGTIATWEHEHVMSPRVKVGDTVTAGQPMAVVSYYKQDNWLYAASLGLYEIGILTGSPAGRPMHVCPALYLKPSAKAQMLTQLAAAARAYEANVGKVLYTPNELATGCITTKPSIE
ncbi:MAG: M23 family metallopeptidase [Candidatus Nanopelagicales bacterium]|nr:M23 family metallopeptidase [Candidatus Nanopelagicales bacterium]